MKITLQFGSFFTQRSSHSCSSTFWHPLQKTYASQVFSGVDEVNERFKLFQAIVKSIRSDEPTESHVQTFGLDQFAHRPPELFAAGYTGLMKKMQGYL